MVMYLYLTIPKNQFTLSEHNNTVFVSRGNLSYMNSIK